jgi:hypothetical protein
METGPTFIFEGNWLTTVGALVVFALVGYKMYKAWKKRP